MTKKEIIYKLMEENQLDAMLLYSPQNRYWFSRFPSSLGYLLVTKKKTYLFLDGRYITAANESEELVNIDLLGTFGDLWTKLNEALKEAEVKNLGFESDWTNYNEYELFSKKIISNLKPVNTENIRMIKDEWEVQKIQKACDITNVVFEEVLKFAKPGMTEIEIARFVSDSFLKNGADKLSFDTIVASGKNGSKPHAVPTEKELELGDFVTLDMGCYYKGYCSDQTRTFVMGEPKDEKLKEIYNIVLQAQQRGIEAIKPGVLSKEIHDICMDYIAEKGYREFFTHGTGHGLGVEIHEQPYQAPSGDKVLEPGMTITVEPGIYIPGIGGVRIEDDILVTEDGYKFLTSSKRELLSIK